MQATRASSPSHRFARRVLLNGLASAGLCHWAALPVDAQPLPHGASVVHGQAAFATHGQQLTVTNSAGSIVNWQGFSVAPGYAVRFEQPNAASQVLNRVVGGQTSEILGRISSNGGVWLLNPNGVLFGASARVDTANLVASTLRISDADWQARRLNLFAPSATPADQGRIEAEVRNLGELRSSTGGQVLLLGGPGGVFNHGRIDTPGGQTVLAAGRSIELVDSSSPHIAVRVNLPAGSAVNTGELRARDGRIHLQAALVSQQGLIDAGGGTGGDAGGGTGSSAGQIRLSAGETLDLAAGSQTLADGPVGGRITLDAGTTLVAGRLSVQGSAGEGGQVRVLGLQVGLLDGARIDASGAAGGGEVLVGGGAQGRDASLPNAQATYMDRSAEIKADARERGTGGHIVLWADNTSRVYGTLSARGGARGGDGGLIETSGGWLDARPNALDTQAPQGRAGVWLIDPFDIRITSATSNLNITASPDPVNGPNFTPANAGAILRADLIVTALEAGNNVTVSTGNQGSQAGDITASGVVIAPRLNKPVSLTLNAAGSIFLVGSSISASGGQRMNLELNAATTANELVRIHGSIIDLPLGQVSLLGGKLEMQSLALGRLVTASVIGANVLVRADSQAFEIGSTIRGLAAGDAVVLTGTTNNASAIVNQAGAALLSTPNGRWLVYVDDPRKSGIMLGTLADNIAFTQHNAAFGMTPTLGIGNGLLTALTPALQLRSAVPTVSKIYDGTLAVLQDPQSFGFTLVGQLPGESQVGGGLTRNLRYDTADVGSGIGMTWLPGGQPVMADTLGRPVYGYGLNTRILDLQGTITPAALIYVADPAVAVRGVRLPPLGGTVTGFVNGETLASATGGQLGFTTPATSGSLAGSYPVDGSGVTARNYVLGQAPANARALSLVDANPQPGPTQLVQVGAISVLPPPVTGQVSDMVGMLPQGVDMVNLFSGLDWAGLAPGQATDALVARDVFTAANQSPALRALEANPRLAQVPDCTNVDDAINGTCLLTRALKPAYLQRCPGSILNCAPAAGRAGVASAVSLALADALEMPPQPASASPMLRVKAPAMAQWLARLPADEAPRAAWRDQIVAQAGAAASASADNARTPQRWLLPIGIGEYTDKRMHGYQAQLTVKTFAAGRDAAYVRDELQARLGYRSIPIPLATKANIFAKLNDLVARAQPGDSVVIYYAGYGQIDKRYAQCYWSASDTNVLEASSWISNQSVGEVLQRIDARQVILLVDSCFNQDGGAPAGGDSLPAGATPAGAASSAAAKRAAVAMVSGTNAPLVDSRVGLHSAFAERVVQAVGDLQAARSGNAVFNLVRSQFERLYGELPVPGAGKSRTEPYLPSYRGSRRGGHEPGADYQFEPRQAGPGGLPPLQ